MIDYADVDDPHTGFEETTSVLSENIKQLTQVSDLARAG